MERPRQEAEARNAKESLDMAFQMSNILDPALDRHTLSLLVAPCDCGVNPESLAALVRDFSLPTPRLRRRPSAGSIVSGDLCGEGELLPSPAPPALI